MKHKIIEKAALKAISEELSIPFSNLLGGYILEELMYLIADSPFNQFLWLKNGNIFGVEQYRKKNILTLEFAYLTNERVIKKGELKPGQKLSLKMAYVMLMYFLNEEYTPEIKWKGRASIDKDVVELEITGEFEEMTVPIQICIREYPENSLRPVPKVLTLFMEPDHSIEYLQYPFEIVLTEQLLSILKNMELIPEMSAYEQIYTILSEETIDGRHIREMLWESCKREEMDLDYHRLEEILSYRDYNYMSKRWEKYLRCKKRKEPSWEEVIEKIEHFLPVIWRSICNDEVFFGDWMPGLARFLD